jgi:acyl carrier protein
MQVAGFKNLEAETIKVVSSYCRREITMGTRLVSDLNLDSLDSAELVAEIEDHFAVVIPMEKLPEMKTVGDIAENLALLLANVQVAGGGQ